MNRLFPCNRFLTVQKYVLGFEATKLTPGSVTLDDLTIDSLKQKMQEIEMKLQGKTSILNIFNLF